MSRERINNVRQFEINEWEDGKPSPFEDKNGRKLQEEPEDDFDEEEDEELDSPKALSEEP